MPRQTFRAPREMSYDELEALLPTDGQRVNVILIQPRGHAGYYRILTGQPVHEGDSLVLYTADAGVPAELDAINASFNARYYPSAPGARAPWPDEVRWIHDELPEHGQRILEICCGGGRITRHLVKGGNRVVGLDNSGACVVAAQGTDGDRVSYLVGSAFALPFRDGAFPVRNAVFRLGHPR